MRKRIQVKDGKNVMGFEKVGNDYLFTMDYKTVRMTDEELQKAILLVNEEMPTYQEIKSSEVSKTEC